mgnify:CR=1 FL=1
MLNSFFPSLVGTLYGLPPAHPILSRAGALFTAAKTALLSDFPNGKYPAFTKALRKARKAEQKASKAAAAGTVAARHGGTQMAARTGSSFASLLLMPDEEEEERQDDGEQKESVRDPKAAARSKEAQDAAPLVANGIVQGGAGSVTDDGWETVQTKRTKRRR